MATRKSRTRKRLSVRGGASVVELGGGPNSPELVIGLVAAVGAPLDLIQQALTEQFRELDYRSEVLRLSAYTSHFKLGSPARGAGEASRIDAMMTLGNEARTKTGRNDILALAAISDIRVKRGSEPGPLLGCAFILRQLKRPEEVYLLRRTYGDGFFLLGIYCPRIERERNLRRLGVSESRMRQLINRDEHEATLGGQALRDTFHLADVFLEVHEDPRGIEPELNRALGLIFGLGINTPTQDESGMFHAFAASLRSGQLGRQVGAAILSQEGDLVSVGTNEVPRFGGGLYWAGDPNDARDHCHRGRDSSAEAEEEIAREILERTHQEWEREPERSKQRLIADLLKQLDSTRVMSLTEFGRAVHAEAEAILSAGRMGTSTRRAKLYCTTFPCHVCAKHIVAAGIEKVTYIEPYPKSRALDLHDDSISIEQQSDGKVLFRPFVGVAPRRFAQLFSMTSMEGEEIPRKDEQGRALTDQSNLRLRMSYFSALQKEDLAAKDLEGLTRHRRDR